MEITSNFLMLKNIKTNMVSVKCDAYKVKVLMVSGVVLNITCKDSDIAKEVLGKLLSDDNSDIIKMYYQMTFNFEK